MPTPSSPDQTPPLSARDVPSDLPLLPLRDVVIFPHMIFPVLVGREASLRSITAAIERDKLLMVCTQRDPNDDELTLEALYRYGSVARILQVLKLPNGLMKVLVDGLFQARLQALSVDAGEVMRASIEVIDPKVRMTTNVKALLRQLDTQFGDYVKMHRSIPNETLIGYESLHDPTRKLYYAASNLLIGIEARQSVLALERPEQQLYNLVRLLSNEIAVMRVEAEIDDKVHANLQQSQRRYFIQEQIRILQEELGEEEHGGSELDALERALTEAPMSPEGRAKAMDELAKLRRMSPMSPEATVSRNYIDWMLAMPWTRYSDDNLDIAHAEEILNEDHYGLEKPKERILEHIAVLNLVGHLKGQILCFVGPPGVGKTSLGKSIARALGRRFVRIALGGVHDEAEIRGHRRTYIGSMPGKIIQAMKKAGTGNPVILLDEIDKMSNDFQGDPSSAMLEVLDPEQNHAFNDHYLDIDYDLSKVLFITTANVRYNIPLPLQDRMEIIELPGYLEHEKLAIARAHLVRKQLELHGLRRTHVRFDDQALLRIIREYTQEAGVRNLEREIASSCRKLARKTLAAGGGTPARTRVTREMVEELLGVPKLKSKRIQQHPLPGSVIGLAWTSVGGDILQVDVTLMAGPERLTLTGQLGDVMKESAQAALSWLRAHAAELGIAPDFHEKREIHIHLPEGAIPKDGPSAGITLALAMLSAITGRPARNDVAMTGEITLHGEVLPIGGLNEKLLAARRYGMKIVLIPRDNEIDLKEISPRITTGLRIVPVARIHEAIPIVFGDEKQRSRAGRSRADRA